MGLESLTDADLGWKKQIYFWMQLKEKWNLNWIWFYLLDVKGWGEDENEEEEEEDKGPTEVYQH